MALGMKEDCSLRSIESDRKLVNGVGMMAAGITLSGEYLVLVFMDIGHAEILGGVGDLRDYKVYSLLACHFHLRRIGPWLE